jgi:UMP-CMP kinase
MALSTASESRRAGPQDPKPSVSTHDSSGAKLKNFKFVFVTGGPGSGKSTQCAKIVENFGFEHLSAGDLLRAEQNSGTEIGNMIKDLIKEGKLVPSEVTVKLILKAISESTNDKFLIDGFPRNEENREVWDRVTGLKPEFILFITGSQEEMERRVLSRAGGRDDDNVETIRKRFKVFNESTLPVIKRYETNTTVHKINGLHSADEVFASIRPLFEPIVQAS